MTETHLNASAGIWDSQSGAFINAKHQYLAEILHDYNSHFSLSWIPPKDRDATDTKPFAIIDSSPGNPPYIMRYLSDAEMENPREIIEWVFMGDLTKHRPADVFARIQAGEAAEMALKLKEKEAQLEADADFGAFVFGDRSKNYWKHNGQEYRK